MHNQFIAKIGRTVGAFFPVEETRRGECLRCGACCRLPFTCPFLTEMDGVTSCAIHSFRPLQCRKYPRSRAEQVCQPCGYIFDGCSSEDPSIQ